MTGLMTKSSLYDMVSMVIPGYLFLLCAKMASGIKFGDDFGITTKAIVLFTASWVVGMLLHYVSKGIFDPVLRNLERDIKKAKVEAYKRIKQEKNIRDYNKAYYKLMPHYTDTVVPILEAHVSFIRSLLLVLPDVLYAVIIKSSSNYCSDDSCCWFMAYIILMMIIYLATFCISRHWNCRCLCLLAFLIFCIMIFAPIVLYFINKADVESMANVFVLPNGLLIFLVALLEVALFFVMRCRQKEIYKHVFEDDYYLRLIDSEKRRN